MPGSYGGGGAAGAEASGGRATWVPCQERAAALSRAHILFSPVSEPNLGEDDEDKDLEPGPSGTSKASAQISGQSDTDITAEFLQPLLTPDNVANLVRMVACFPQGQEGGSSCASPVPTPHWPPVPDGTRGVVQQAFPPLVDLIPTPSGGHLSPPLSRPSLGALSPPYKPTHIGHCPLLSYKGRVCQLESQR